MKARYLLVLITSVLCLAAVTPALATVPPTTIYLEPDPPGEYWPGEQFNVMLMIDAVTDLALWAVSITWDPNVVEIVTGDPDGWKSDGVWYNIYAGSIFAGQPELWPFNRIADFHNIDPVHGLITELPNALIAGSATVTVPTDLAMIMFKVRDDADPCTHSIVSIIFSDLLDPAGKSIPHVVGPGLFHIIPELPAVILGLGAMLGAFVVYGYRRRNH